MDVVGYNSLAWDAAVERSNGWTVPVSSEIVAAARRGDWNVILTPSKPVPREWFGEIRGKEILCLASGGGQQAPIFAAAGATVTSFDNSARQLEQDRYVAEREGLDIRLEKGDAADLSRFGNESFDLIFHPCSNCFMPKLRPIWDECFRVLRPGGGLLVGFTKPEVFIFDRFEEEKNRVLKVRHSLPYSDLSVLTVEELAKMEQRREPLEFSHTLEEQLGGQTTAGFHIVGLYEDYWNNPDFVIDKFMPAFAATRAVKP
ncbi:MAG TPA: methyltransferase domain-containing protein [Pyrinomonadaceae bacterium]|nr:methyltransferase domain-containing protein [Pyrinomonadaceae bacterium]